MLARFIKGINDNHLFNPKDRILLAVSGGVDSMVMVHLFLSSGFNFSVAHANFKLRGMESDADEMFVKVACLINGIKFYSHSFEDVDKERPKGSSIQMAARSFRYDWFFKLLEEEQYQYVATGHHKNDNIETALMNWANGGGIYQLLGIREKNNKVIRPMLDFTRAEIKKYACSQNIQWREDSSNDSVSYDRNFVRHNIIPPLKKINPNLEQTVSVSIEKLKGSMEILNIGLQKVKQDITISEDERLFIDKRLLLQYTNSVSVCFELLRPFGFDWSNCLQMVGALSGQSGKRFLSKTHQSVVDRKFIVISPLSKPFQEITIFQGQNEVVSVSQKLKLSFRKSLDFSKAKNEAYLDSAKIKFPLIWRKWEYGDYYFPLGSSHRKKISDFLIDNKLSLSDKDDVTVLVSEQNIVWVVGMRVDDRYKITLNTKNVLRIEVS